MTLADALDNGPPPTPQRGPPCSMGLWLSRMDDTTRDKVQTILGDRAWGHQAIADVLAANGYPEATAHRVSNHRRGKCQCD